MSTEAAEAGIKKNTFYYQLESILDNVPSSDTIILTRNMNAKVGSYIEGDGSVAGNHRLGSKNDNGTRFVDCCQRHGLVIGGTIFPHKGVHKSTWMSPDGVTGPLQISSLFISNNLQVNLYKYNLRTLYNYYITGLNLYKYNLSAEPQQI